MRHTRALLCLFPIVVALFAGCPAPTENTGDSAQRQPDQTPLITGDRDSDGDGLTDREERLLGTALDNADTDGDGIPDLVERQGGTSPLLSDSDADGLSDSRELEIGTDPIGADSDNDGLNDGDEVARGTNPLLADSDADGLPDGDEIAVGADPLRTDTDGDGLIDGDERVRGLNPSNADTDGDGLNDGDEVTRGTNALIGDTDGDGLRDNLEISLGTNPLVADTDGDGLSDSEETTYLTNPVNADTDGDGIDDGIEILNQLNPLAFNEIAIVLTVYSARGATLTAGGLWFTEGFLSGSGFSSWLPGDLVVVDRTSEVSAVATLRNITAGQWIVASEHGLVIDSGYITDAAIDYSWIEIDWLRYALNRYDSWPVGGWHFGDFCLVTTYSISGLRYVVNISEGEAVLRQ